MCQMLIDQQKQEIYCYLDYCSGGNIKEYSIRFYLYNSQIEDINMVCDGPDPPDDSPQNLIPPPRNELTANGNHDESDEEQNEHFGYEPLPQGPEAVFTDHESDDDVENNGTQQSGPNNVPPIEPMESALTREVWNVPRVNDPIQMDSERAQQVMSLMADFALPQGSIPEWAQSVSEEQWKETLNDRIEKLRGNR